MTARSLVPFDPAVVAPWWLGEGSTGVLLLHGFAGTPPEMRGIGEHLAAHGFRCHAPLLAGHGTTPEDLRRTTWRSWEESALAALAALRAECSEVVVCGQSMGGALALHLAANDLGIRAVAALAAPVWLRSRLLPALPLLKLVVPWQYPGTDVDLWDAEAVNRLYSYGRRGTRSIHELVRLLRTTRKELASVRQPVLVLHGARDRVIDPANSEEIVARLVCSSAVERVILPRSGHAISVDVDREEVAERVQRWFEVHAGAGGAGGQGLADRDVAAGRGRAG